MPPKYTTASINNLCDHKQGDLIIGHYYRTLFARQLFRKAIQSLNVITLVQCMDS